LAHSFLLDLSFTELDLSGEAFYGLDIGEPLLSQFVCSSLNLLDAWGKTADFAF
jgi:hypothetical protein